METSCVLFYDKILLLLLPPRKFYDRKYMGTGPNFIIKDLPSMFIVIIADQNNYYK